MDLPIGTVRAIQQLSLLLGPSVATALVLRRLVKSRRIWLGMPLAVLIANPFLQVFLFEPFDDTANLKLGEFARQSALVGMSPEEVTALLGRPDEVHHVGASFIQHTDGSLTPVGEPCIEWDYQPIGWYWFGSKLQVFFSDAKRPVVTSIDPNDD
jgi:hypothetical protein